MVVCFWCLRVERESVRARARKFVCLYIRAYVCVNVYIYMYTCVYMYIYICICTYIYIYIYHGNFVNQAAKSGSLRKTRNFHRNLSAELILLCFCQFGTCFRTPPGALARAVHDEHAELKTRHDMACVVKCGNKSLFFLGANESYFLFQKKLEFQKSFESRVFIEN